MPLPTRLLCPDITTAALAPDDLTAQDIVEGSPTASVLSLDEIHTAGVGLWEMTEGTARDIEVDEVFVVVSGRGSVTFEDGERIDLAPGVAVRLRSGERTEWTVTEVLRKIWVA